MILCQGKNIVLGKAKLLGNIVAKRYRSWKHNVVGGTLSDRDPIYPRSIPFNALNHNAPVSDEVKGAKEMFVLLFGGRQLSNCPHGHLAEMHIRRKLWTLEKPP